MEPQPRAQPPQSPPPARCSSGWEAVVAALAAMPCSAVPAASVGPAVKAMRIVPARILLIQRRLVAVRVRCPEVVVLADSANPRAVVIIRRPSLCEPVLAKGCRLVGSRLATFAGVSQRIEAGRSGGVASVLRRTSEACSSSCCVCSMPGGSAKSSGRPLSRDDGARSRSRRRSPEHSGGSSLAAVDPARRRTALLVSCYASASYVCSVR